jgi:hypothetical protein
MGRTCCATFGTACLALGACLWVGLALGLMRLAPFRHLGPSLGTGFRLRIALGLHFSAMLFMLCTSLGTLRGVCSTGFAMFRHSFLGVLAVFRIRGALLLPFGAAFGTGFRGVLANWWLGWR